MARTWSCIRRMAFSLGTHDPRLPTAAFDFDSTLRPYRGRGPPEGLTLSFLSGLAASFNLVIITNRSANTSASLAPIQQYVEALDARLGARRIAIYAPTARDRDRKPHTGAWEFHIAEACKGVRPWFAFFCGDAAGRPGDHSACDYMFALNLGLAFLVPEALFGRLGPSRGSLEAQGLKSAGLWDAPHAHGCVAAQPLAAMPRGEVHSLAAELSPRGPWAVVLVGSPASGKTRLASELLAACGFTHISRDVQGARHHRAFEEALAAGHSVVVDNTNPRAADRAAFAGPAQARGYSVIVVHVATPQDVCFHLNAARCQLDPTGGTKEIPPVALRAFWKHLEPPTEKEAAAGGWRLVRVPFRLAPNAPPEVAHFVYPRA